MKRFVTLVCMICMGVLLCGCQKNAQEVPQEVKDSKAQPAGIRFCSVEELRNTKLSDLSYKPEHIELPSEIHFSGIEEVAFLFMELQKMSSGMEEIAFLDKIHNIKDSAPVKNHFRMDQDDISDVKVGLKDGEFALSGMCLRAKKWLNDKQKGSGFEYQISDAYLCSDGDNQTLLRLCAEYEYKGMRLNNDIFGSEAGDSGIYGGDAIVPYFTELRYSSSGEILNYMKVNGGLKQKKAEKIDHVVDFESALRIVEEKVQSSTQKFTDVIPMYLPMPKEYSTDENGKISIPNRSEIIGRPVYAFIRRDLESDDTYRVNACEAFYCVDMVTGECLCGERE